MYRIVNRGEQFIVQRKIGTRITRDLGEPFADLASAAAALNAIINTPKRVIPEDVVMMECTDAGELTFQSAEYGSLNLTR